MDRLHTRKHRRIENQMTLPPGRKPLGNDWFAEQIDDFSQVTRVEVIDNDGRRYVKYNVTDVQLSLQDTGRTLKLFVQYQPEDEISDD